VLFARRYYGADMAGFSIPASEHSTMTSWGQEREADAYSNMIDKFGATGLYAVVSDSYDINNAVSEIWGKQLKERVQAAGGTLVVRPDSGDPVETPVQVVPMPSAPGRTPRATRCSTTASASSRATVSRPPISA
jgi:nicotinamide phosphoribosyltransferase